MLHTAIYTSTWNSVFLMCDCEIMFSCVCIQCVMIVTLVFFFKKRQYGTYQNWEVRAGGVGKWASSAPMLSKKRPVKLLPSIAGMLDGANHPINPNPITLKSLRSQSLWKLLFPTSPHTRANHNHISHIYYSIYWFPSSHKTNTNTSSLLLLTMYTFLPRHVPASEGFSPSHWTSKSLMK